MTPEERAELLRQVSDAVNRCGVRQSRACEALGLSERRLRDWKLKGLQDGRQGGYRAKGQKLSQEEKRRVLELLNQPAYYQLPVRVAHATLLKEGICLCSPSSMYRIVHEAKQTERLRKAGATRGARPELKASVPNQVWCWDITYLPTGVNGAYYYFYAALDLYSRRIMAHCVQNKEDGALARDMFADAIQSQVPSAEGMVLHADNGAPMKHQGLRRFLERLGVVRSFSRPHTSNDNAFAESLFATFKSRMGYPEQFRSLEDAEIYCARFVRWYNTEHCHSALEYLTPDEVYEGKAEAIQEVRNTTLEAHRALHRERYGRRLRIYRVPGPTELKHRTQLVATKEVTAKAA